jgi:DNA polymerase
MKIITIDFETYYDREFSLSKITTEEYIRHEMFETIGVGVKVNDGRSEWFSGTHQETQDYLNSFDWSDAIAVAHNAMFDAAILSWRFNIQPHMWIDTLSLARAIDGADVSVSLKSCAERHNLGEKGTEVVNALSLRRQDFDAEQLARYGEYCKNDCDLTYALALVYLRDLWLKPLEMHVVDLTTRMFSEPVLELDLPLLEQHLMEVCDRKAELMAACASSPEILNSSPKFADLLRSLGVDPPMKISPATGRDTYAFAKTDEGMKALLDHEDERVQAVVAARLGTKSTLEETRTERMINIAKRGTLPVPLRYYAAHTGRWGGTDKLNLQNLPRGSVIKQAITAPKGHVIIDADSSQIEARVLAWLAGQEDLVREFAANVDVYTHMAAVIYNTYVDSINKDQRFVGKVVILGCGYGMGAEALLSLFRSGGNYKVEVADCKTMIKAYRQRHRAIVKLWDDAQTCLTELHQYKRKGVLGVRDDAIFMSEKGFVLPNGFLISYPDLKLERVYKADSYRDEFTYKTRTGKSKIYGGKVVENVVQALARCVIAEQMVSIAERYRPVLTVHDAVAVVVPESESAEAIQFVNACMKRAPAWAQGLPLNCEIGVGRTYGECEKKRKYP